MGVVIAVGNQKGGVGKTTTAVTLAAGMARKGRRVLLVDLDSQGNVADSLGLEAGHELTRLLSPVLPEPLEECTVQSGRERLEVVRADKTTTALKTTLAGVDFREYVLANALEGAPQDVVLLDCAPSMDVLHTAALVAADWLIIPVKLDQLAVKGVRDLLVTMAEIHRMRRTVCQLLGVVPTFYDRTTSETQRQLTNLAKQFKTFVLPPVPEDTKCREATRAGKTLWEYASQSRALIGVPEAHGKNAGGYIQVLDRVMEAVR